MSVKQYLRSIFNYKGFSLAETLISAALLGGVGVVMLNMDDSQNVDENFSETDMTIEILYQGIYMALEDPATCTEALGKKGASIGNGNAIKVYKHDGTVLAQAGTKDSRELIEIMSMTTANFNKKSAHNYAEIDVEITFKKLVRQLAQASGGIEREITHTVPLQLDMQGSVLESCFLPATESANTLICRQFFGTYDEKTQECTLPFYGKTCVTSPAACLRSMAVFDAQAKFSCVTTSIEPDNTESCLWP